jgi:hypothetical protein
MKQLDGEAIGTGGNLTDTEVYPYVLCLSSQ